MKVVISGSFRKHLSGIIQLKQELERNEIQVIKPDKVSTIENRANPNFVKFQGEEKTAEWMLELSFLRAIQECDAHIIYNKDSYLGSMARFEFGFSIKSDRKIYLLEKPNADKWIEKNEVTVKEEQQDIRQFCSLLKGMEKEGIIGIGIESLYKDFKIKNIDGLER